MLKLNTRDFGEIEVAEDKVITFPAGLFAFEDARRFALISPLGDGVYPMWLQSADDAIPCFIVFDPTQIDPEYQVSLAKTEEKLLEIQPDTDVIALVIAKVPEDFRQSTVNMKSPIIINSDKKIGTQIILPNDYPFRLPIYDDVPQAEEGVR